MKRNGSGVQLPGDTTDRAVLAECIEDACGAAESMRLRGPESGVIRGAAHPAWLAAEVFDHKWHELPARDLREVDPDRRRLVGRRKRPVRFHAASGGWVEVKPTPGRPPRLLAQVQDAALLRLAALLPGRPNRAERVAEAVQRLTGRVVEPGAVRASARRLPAARILRWEGISARAIVQDAGLDPNAAWAALGATGVCPG